MKNLYFGSPKISNKFRENLRLETIRIFEKSQKFNFVYFIYGILGLSFGIFVLFNFFGKEKLNLDNNMMNISEKNDLLTLEDELFKLEEEFEKDETILASINFEN